MSHSISIIPSLRLTDQLIPCEIQFEIGFFYFYELLSTDSDHLINILNQRTKHPLQIDY